MTLRLRAVAGSARGNIGVRNSVSKDIFACGHEFFWSTPEGFGVKILKFRGNGRYHCRPENVGHIGHDVVRPPALDKCL